MVRYPCCWIHHAALDDDATVMYGHSGIGNVRTKATIIVLCRRPTAKALDPLMEPQAEHRSRVGSAAISWPALPCWPHTPVVRSPWLHPARDRSNCFAMASAPDRPYGASCLRVVELAEQALRPDDGGGLRGDPVQPLQHAARRAGSAVAGLSKGVSLRLDALQLLQQELEVRASNRRLTRVIAAVRFLPTAPFLVPKDRHPIIATDTRRAVDRKPEPAAR